MNHKSPQAALRHHVSGAIERGEKTAIAGIPVLILAELDTERFHFTALGSSEAEARAAMRGGAAAHGRQYDLRPDWFKSYESSITYTPLALGAAYRDGEKLTD